MPPMGLQLQKPRLTSRHANLRQDGHMTDGQHLWLTWTDQADPNHRLWVQSSIDLQKTNEIHKCNPGCC